MAAVHLANAIGGNIFLGFMSAVAFATILAVVAGLTLSGASAVAHDLYASALKKGKASSSEELKISKLTTVALGIIAMFLGIVFEKQALPGFPWVADLLMSFPEGTNEGYGPIFSDSRTDRALVC